MAKTFGLGRTARRSVPATLKTHSLSCVPFGPYFVNTLIQEVLSVQVCNLRMYWFWGVFELIGVEI